ncbi:MAG: GNAT family N-acetyltransferase [Rhodospirillales bacterium]|nr:GNAT family N-acetyltransferase [Rhodospirillales bacterium]MBO6786580.1 GNAT family N-acetyltransferase [Rhodospirillales bacterium]
MPITIRALAPADKDRWKELWEGYLTFYEAPIDDTNTATLWERLMADADPHCLVACDDAGRVIGMVQYLFHATTWSAADKCYLQDLFVDPNARIGGAGRALIEAVYEKAAKAGASEVYWMTQQFNSVARVLYDRVGELTPFIKYRKLM